MQHSCHSFLCGEGRDSEEVIDMWHTSEVFNFVLGGGGNYYQESIIRRLRRHSIVLFLSSPFIPFN